MGAADSSSVGCVLQTFLLEERNISCAVSLLLSLVHFHYILKKDFSSASQTRTTLLDSLSMFFMVHPETLSTGHGLLCLQKPKECKGWGTNAEMITIWDLYSPLPLPKIALISDRQFTLLHHTNYVINNPHRFSFSTQAFDSSIISCPFLMHMTWLAIEFLPKILRADIYSCYILICKP